MKVREDFEEKFLINVSFTENILPLLSPVGHVCLHKELP